MKYAAYTIALFTLLISFGSCEKDINIDLPYEGNKIVLNALMLRDSTIYVRLTSSSELNSGNNFPVPAGARVDLYENDIFKETLSRRIINGREFFASSFPSQLGKKYTCKASATGMDAAEGADVIPAKPSFYGEEFKEVTVNGSRTYRLKIRVIDPPGTGNYYRLRLYEADTNTSAQGPRVIINKNQFFSFTINNFSDGSTSDLFGDNFYRQLYFTDETFDGREISLTVDVSYYGGSTYIAPELVQLTRDAYRYLQSRETQRNNDGNPFSEAVVVYNNVKGGYGIVGGMADSLTAVRLQ